MNNSIYAIGDLTLDILFKELTSDKLQWGEEIETGSIQKRVGGNIGNMAIGASLLDTDFKVVADIGNDQSGEYILKKLEAIGVNTNCVRITDGSVTSESYISVRSDGERFIVTSKGTLSDIDVTFEDAVVPMCKAVFLGGWCLPPRIKKEQLIKKIKSWHDKGTVVSTDLIWSDETWNSKDELVELLKCIDVVIMNEKELFQLTQTETRDKAVFELKQMLNLEARKDVIVIAKLGSNGAMIIDSNEQKCAKTYPCTPIDTVGAGDSFNIGFLHAKYQMQLDNIQAVQFATIFASLFISYQDKRLITQSSVEKIMADI